jgi:hypothetical protein
MQVRIQSFFLTLSITANEEYFHPYFREGSKTLLFSGNSLQTVNGVSTVGNVSTIQSFYYRARLPHKRRLIPFYISCKK